MAGIIGIYGLVVSVLISDGLKQHLPLYTSFIQFGAGLSVGLAGLAAGFAIGIVGDAGVRGTAQQPRLFVGMILILIFAEVLGMFLKHCIITYYPLTNPLRSLRSDCRPAHELQGQRRGYLLNSTHGDATCLEDSLTTPEPHELLSLSCLDYTRQTALQFSPSVF